MCCHLTQRLNKPCALIGLSALLLRCLTTAQGASLPTGKGIPPSYAQAKTMEHLLHWRRMPLRVFFVPTEAATADRRREVLAGFSEWEQATGGAMAYRLAESLSQADLTVTIDSAATVPGKEGAVGNTLVVYTRAELESAAMELAAGRTTPNQLQEVAAHEFGHALGIDGHSDDPDDLMAPVEMRFYGADGLAQDAPAHAVTARDLNTLRACYGPLLATPARPKPDPSEADPDSETVGPTAPPG